MKIIDCKQQTPEWFACRAGIPTASEFDSLVTPLWKIRTGDGVNTYLARKLAERWLGHPIITFSGNAQTDQGNILEQEVIPMFELLWDCEIQRPGFITTDDGSVGCSPDGWLEDGAGVEIKSPLPSTHCAYLIANELPKDYAAQVHGSMYVTGAKEWKFVSYCRGFPSLVLTVERDEAAMAAIDEALLTFNAKLSLAYQKLVTLNSGRDPHQRTKCAPYQGVT
jgi:hypothetical protein